MPLGAKVDRGASVTMFSPDNAGQASSGQGDAHANQSDVEHGMVYTDPHLRSFDRRTLLAERRQSILQQKQTDALPKVTVETSNAKVTRQLVTLREENRHLHIELDQWRLETERLLAENRAIQAQFDHEVATVHSGNAQELEFYQKHLSELQAERNRLQDENAQLEQRYQDLYGSFREAVDEEARIMVQRAARTLELPAEETPLLLQDVVKTIELHAQEVEDSHLVEVLHFKDEVQRRLELLEQERQQVEQERQWLVVMHNSVREQAKARFRIMEARLHHRWKASYVFMISSMLVMLIALQCVAMLLFHVPMQQTLFIALVLPFVVGVVVTGILVNFISHARHLYESAPHKKKVKKDAPAG